MRTRSRIHHGAIGATRDFAQPLTAVTCRPKREQVEIILTDLEFGWTKAQMLEFRQLWAIGQSIPEIADYFGRQDDEVLLLMIHEARQGNISARPGGIFGHAKNVPPDAQNWP